jgi:hypothetical protein
MILDMSKLALIIMMWLCIFIIAGCKGNKDVSAARGSADTAFVFRHEPANAVYHWKRTFALNGYENGFFKKHDIKRLYLKFFDVSTDNLYDGKGIQPVPIATTIFMDSTKIFADKSVEIVPVVFVTVEALRLEKPLAERIVKRVDDMCRANHINYNEIQLDCDWTKETKDLFYSLCQEVKLMLHNKRKGLSATIRLHQLRDSLPDIDYGVLMLYNTESLSNPKVKNSILNSEAVKEYMRHAKSDKHLDFAYPTYEWALWFQNGKFKGIVNSNDSIHKKGELRYEKSEFGEIMKTKSVLRLELKDINYPSSTIIYHLDSANLSKYRDDEIEKIYSR